MKKLDHVLRAVDERIALNATHEAAEPTLYHVTYAGRLPGITEEGLRPNAPRAIGASGYDAHARDRVFLTEGDGVFFWHHRAEDFAEHMSDNPLEDELVPVVLHVGYFIQAPMEPIGSDCLEVFDGKEWVSLGTEDLDLESAFDVEEPDPPDCDDDCARKTTMSAERSTSAAWRRRRSPSPSTRSSSARRSCLRRSTSEARRHRSTRRRRSCRNRTCRSSSSRPGRAGCTAAIYESRSPRTTWVCRASGFASTDSTTFAQRLPWRGR
jgi:hypothetical protein